MNNSRPLVVGLCLSLLGAAACTGDNVANAPGRGTVPSSSVTPAAKQLPTPANMTRPWRVRGLGVPHSSNINAIAISMDGKAALSRDTVGGMRLWPSLDGSKQPFPIPARGAIKFSLVTDGSDFVVGYVDSANAAHVIRVSASGKVKALMSTPPHKPVTQLELLPGGAGVVTLHKDHTFHLWTVKGTELASYEQRSFRPFRFRIADDGKSLVALIQESEDLKASTRDLSFHRFAISTSARPSLKKIGDERQVKVTRGVPVAISPDGKRAAYVAINKKTTKPKGPTATTHPKRLVSKLKVGKWNAVVIDLVDTQKDALTVKSNMTLANGPVVAFVNPTQIMVTGGVVARSWLIDIKTGKTHGRVGPPSHFASLRVPSAFAGNRRITGLSGWLFVQDVKKGKHHYVGFMPFAPTSGAVSPNGKWVAWPSSGGHVWVESVGTGLGRVIHLKRAQMTPASRAFFIDDDHLLLANTVGGLAIIEWASGKQLSTADASGPFRDIEYMPSRRVLRVTRTNNEIWLFKVSKKNQFGGPHMLDITVSHGGLLRAKTASAPILWTRDSKGKYRTHTWAQLTGAGPSKDPPNFRLRPRGIKGGGASGAPMPTADMVREEPRRRPFFAGRAYDRFGFTYRLVTPKVRNNPTDMLIEVRDIANKLDRSILIDTNRVSKLLPSPDARKLLVVEHTGLVSAWDQKTGKRLWSFNFLRATSDVRWSTSGKHVIATSTLGASVLKGETGGVVHKSCGSWFERRSTAPQIRFTQNQPHICEL